MVQRKDIKTEDIVELYQRGLIGREIAEKLGCSVSLVQQRLAKARVKMRPCNERVTRLIDKNVIEEMYWDKEMHPREIGKEFGVHKQTIVNKMKDYGIPLRTKSEARRGKLNPIFEVGHSKETRQKMSDVIYDGTKDLTVSGNNRWGKKIEYKDNVFRSMWEYGFARYLDTIETEWQYEPHKLKYSHKGISRTYVPDFYLPRGFLSEVPCYVEIKGFCDKLGKSKLKSIQGQVENLVVLYRDDLFKLGIIDLSGKVLIA